ncbi:MULTISPECIES: hypothetical protein [unclassified Afipia]|uniref:hypothetical protein n=1 Tax=unclassified Afipia TaxID=2642050 RepID=UPI0004677AFF|nr:MULTISPECIES: hypothetical protein [unclassified Afipia]
MAQRNAKAKRSADKQTPLGDVKFWKLHDLFSIEYAKQKALDTPLARQEKGSPAAVAAHEAWQAQLLIVDAVARRIASARTFTVEGMLAKIQVCGSMFGWVGTSFQHNASTPTMWEPQPRPWSPPTEEQLLIVSLRADLLHLRGAR